MTADVAPTETTNGSAKTTTQDQPGLGDQVVKLLGPDLRGQSVLILGRGWTQTALTIARQGVGRVVGLDLDAQTLDLIRERRDAEGLPIEARYGDLEADLPCETFDHIVVQNVLHRVRTPLALLHAASERSSRSLVLVPPRALTQSDRPGFSAVTSRPTVTQPVHWRPCHLHWWAEMARRPASANRSSSSLLKRFAMSSWNSAASSPPLTWLTQVPGRATSWFKPIGGPCRNCWWWRASRAAGRAPSWNGWNRLAPRSVAVARAAGIDQTKPWRFLNSEGLRQTSRMPSWPRCVALRPACALGAEDAGIHARDQGLDVLIGADNIRSVLLSAPRRSLQARLRSELDGLADKSTRAGRRLQDVIDLYDRPTHLHNSLRPSLTS